MPADPETNSTAVLPAISARVAECLGLPRVVLEAQLGGASNLAFSVSDPDDRNAPVAFVRCEGTDGGFGGERYGLRHEIGMLRAAQRLGFPVANVLGTFEDPVGLVMSFVTGEARPDPELAEAVAPEYLALVARLHEIDPAEFGFDGPATVREAIADDLSWWEGHARRTGGWDQAIVRLGHRVLESTIPGDDSRPCVVHGDVGAGNFMVDQGRVSAMLDWELTHVGDPHEDLAWLWMRGAHTAFGQPGARLPEYEKAAGRSLDDQRIAWHLAFVMWKSCVAVEAFLRGREADQATLLQVVVLLTYEALLGAQLVRLVGGAIQLLEGAPEAEPAPDGRLAERVLATEKLSTESRIAIEYLGTVAAHAAWVERERLGDLERVGHGKDTSLIALIDAASEQELAGITWVIARDADRRVRAMPKAVRRVQRAQLIGLGTANRVAGGPR